MVDFGFAQLRRWLLHSRNRNRTLRWVLGVFLLFNVVLNCSLLLLLGIVEVPGRCSVRWGSSCTLFDSFLQPLHHHHQQSEPTDGMTVPRVVAKVLVLPSRLSIAQTNLAPVLQQFNSSTDVRDDETTTNAITYIPAISRETLDLGYMKGAFSLRAEWDSMTMRYGYGLWEDQLSEGEVACLLGHRRMLESFVRDSNEKASVALLLEDDAVVASPEKQHQHVPNISKLLAALPEDWEFVQLGRCWDIHCNDMRQYPVASVQLTKDMVVQVFPSAGFELCTHAYLVSRAGAEKLLQYTVPMVLPYVRVLIS